MDNMLWILNCILTTLNCMMFVGFVKNKNELYEKISNDIDDFKIDIYHLESKIRQIRCGEHRFEDDDEEWQ